MQTTSEPRKGIGLIQTRSWIILLLMLHATAAFGVNFNVPLGSLTNHNTSAYAAYNQANFGANFGTTSWVNQNGTTITVDPTKVDESLNPITPGHVSKTDVHTLIPSRPDLRWFAHATPWFGSSSHINIGLNNNSASYVAAMITDMKNRGFDGVVIDWYGQGSVEDQAMLKMQSYLAGLTNNTFKYILMLDKGVAGGLSTNNLQAQIQYCQNQYFNDTNYEREPLTNGMPILMFFGVRTVVGSSGMSAVKASTGGNMVWVEQGISYINEPWEDQTFQWTDNFDTGVNTNDPFNLGAVTSEFTTIKNSGKKAFGALCSQFNGTLTKSVGWSLGKYLPSSNGLCMVQRAASINTAIPGNMTRMQWPTWSDWEEGTQVETGIENNVALSAHVNAPNLLSWTVTSGEPQTIDHFEIYASSNGVNAAFLGSAPSRSSQTNISTSGLPPGNYQLYVDAIGKPCVRDHLSQPLAYFFETAPILSQQPTNVTVSVGGTATFTVSPAGTPPFGYAWYDQSNNLVGTASNLIVNNATQNNSYFVTVTNQYGSISSAHAALTVLTPALILQSQQGSNGQIVLTWASGTLQSAPAIQGPYTDMTNTSSPFTLVPSGGQQYFRVKVR